jgi:hypothetical protein
MRTLVETKSTTAELISEARISAAKLGVEQAKLAEKCCKTAEASNCIVVQPQTKHHAKSTKLLQLVETFGLRQRPKSRSPKSQSLSD